MFMLTRVLGLGHDSARAMPRGSPPNSCLAPTGKLAL